jgi:hypothetical protein
MSAAETGRAAGRARVAVVGPGAIGLAFAAAVQEAGRAELVLCGRRELAEVTVTREGMGRPQRRDRPAGRPARHPTPVSGVITPLLAAASGTA